MSEATQRLFFALWPDAATSHALATLAQQVAAESGGRVFRVRALLGLGACELRAGRPKPAAETYTAALEAARQAQRSGGLSEEDDHVTGARQPKIPFKAHLYFAAKPSWLASC